MYVCVCLCVGMCVWVCVCVYVCMLVCLFVCLSLGLSVYELALEIFFFPFHERGQLLYDAFWKIFHYM